MRDERSANVIWYKMLLRLNEQSATILLREYKLFIKIFARLLRHCAIRYGR
jgi:hypothetical protein